MDYRSFKDLPGHLRRHLKKFNWSDDKLEEWIKRPVPALGNISILEALSRGQLVEVNNVVLRVGEALNIRDNFDS